MDIFGKKHDSTDMKYLLCFAPPFLTISGFVFHLYRLFCLPKKLLYIIEDEMGCNRQVSYFLHTITVILQIRNLTGYAHLIWNLNGFHG